MRNSNQSDRYMETEPMRYHHHRGIACVRLSRAMGSIQIRCLEILRLSFSEGSGSAKAVDIIAIHANQRLWLIEIKDYRAEARQKAIELAEEFALKVRDTVAGLMAASSAGQ